MNILAHRGFWLSESEKNTLISIDRAFSEGFGIETDIRDRNGKIVISHNPPDENAPLFEDVLKIWEKYDRPMLALNIKADELYLLLEDILKKYGLTEKNYFLFDSSVPEQYIYIKRNYNIFTRSSEFEKNIAFFQESRGIWLDQFTDCSHIENTIKELLDSGKLVTIVSPELHRRDKKMIWKYLLQYKNNDKLYLCTDTPKEAEDFFK